ncbi:hypothetical protein ACFL6H_03495 [Candidatus Latescibacterota bacterium]
MSNLYKGMEVTVKKKKKGERKPFNKNWEAEITEYDKKCGRIEDEYRKNHIVIKDSGSNKLTAGENEVLTLFINGVSCREIAEKTEVEEEVVTGLLELIRAKLSLED